MISHGKNYPNLQVSGKKKKKKLNLPNFYDKFE
jgi:hypothetical protein